MKILKIGEIPGTNPYQATCGHCKTDLEFMESEAKLVQDRNDTCLVVACPVCNREVWKDKR